MGFLLVMLLCIIIFFLGGIIGIKDTERIYDKKISEGLPIIVDNTIYIAHKAKVE